MTIHTIQFFYGVSPSLIQILKSTTGKPIQGEVTFLQGLFL